jgi:hypothetical protein
MEVLPLSLRSGGIHLVTLGDLPLQVGWHAEVHPNEIACRLVAEFALTPVVAHSTSWRHQPGKVILTYVAIVDEPATLPPMLRSRPIARDELARGSALRAPAVIGVEQVVEHALRHLSWLQRDDPMIRDALSPSWVIALQIYPPEPFRPFESGWGA